MPPRQVWLFQFGCWVTIGVALLHLVGHLMGQKVPENDTERQLVTLATTYRYVLPGGAERSLMDFLNGFSLMFAIFAATMGSAGLIVQKRARHDVPLMLGVARTFTVASAALLGLSLTHFFIVPTMGFAAMAVCFFCASVKAP